MFQFGNSADNEPIHLGSPTHPVQLNQTKALGASIQYITICMKNKSHRNIGVPIIHKNHQSTPNQDPTHSNTVREKVYKKNI